MRKIILDVDTGTDDAMAIIVAACSKDIDLAALTVVHGNQPLPNTLENTLRMVDFLGIDTPVYGGCPDPMVQTMVEGRMKNVRKQKLNTVVDGEVISIHDAYLPLPKAVSKPQKQHAVSFLVDTLRDAKEPVTVVAVGPATNLGMALRMDPSIAKNIEELVIMGGGVHAVNRTSDAEMNFYMDPEAAQLMIKAKCKITILPLDATTSALFTKADGEKLIALGNDRAKFFGELITHFVDRITLLGISNNDDPNDHSVAIHDALCILYLIDPTIITDLRHEICDVDFGGGFADGQLIVDSRSYVKNTEDVYVAYKVDKEKVMSMLLEILV